MIFCFWASYLINTLCYQVVSFTVTRGGFGGLEINLMQRFPHGPNSGQYEFARCQMQVLLNLVTRSRMTKPATLTDKRICKHASNFHHVKMHCGFKFQDCSFRISWIFAKLDTKAVYGFCDRWEQWRCKQHFTMTYCSCHRGGHGCEQ
jgi:hypothetical protein